MRILVTGGSGFIGSNLIRFLIKETDHIIFNIDKLTYASSKASLKDIENHKRYYFSMVDISNTKEVSKIFNKFKPEKIVHLAAESHVDRSIENPDSFILSNIFGTYTLLKIAQKYFKSLSENQKKHFLFHHVSTDEVYGDLDIHDTPFSETNSYLPSSPYSASKASSDHLVRAWHKTYDLPVVITNCSNNFGPYQFPEKLIPVIILNALDHKKIPIYGDGQQIRDWLFVDDHVAALCRVFLSGKPGNTYNIGGDNEKTNLSIAKSICRILDKLRPIANAKINSYEELIDFVPDRLGHDKRYAINAHKIKSDLGWRPYVSFDDGLEITVNWYLSNIEWTNSMLSASGLKEAKIGAVRK